MGLGSAEGLRGEMRVSRLELPHLPSKAGVGGTGCFIWSHFWCSGISAQPREELTWLTQAHPECFNLAGRPPRALPPKAGSTGRGSSWPVAVGASVLIATVDSISRPLGSGLFGCVMDGAVG